MMSTPVRVRRKTSPGQEVVDDIKQAGAHVLVTEFEIKRLATIPSDSGEHSVSIGVVDMEPQLLHKTVPSKNKAVFLTASAVNSSQLPFLAGPAAVYLDGSFIANTSLGQVPPGERFSCSLGVDTSISLEYKPAHKFNEQSGLLSKTVCIFHEQEITIRNTRGSSPVIVTVYEHIPKSTDDKIKVKVLTPETHPLEQRDPAALPEMGAFLNRDGNLEWTIQVAHIGIM